MSDYNLCKMTKC